MIEIYNENMELLHEEPDMSLGYLTYDTKTVHHEAIEGVEEVWHHEVIAEYPNGGKDVRKVIDVPGVKAKPAWDEEVQIAIYVPYPEDVPVIEEGPTQMDRIEAQVLYTALMTDTLIEDVQA